MELERELMSMRLICKFAFVEIPFILTRDETDLSHRCRPTVTVDADTGVEKQTNEAWLWILISRPMVSFDPNDKSTYVAPTSSEFDTPSSDSRQYHTPPSNTSKLDGATLPTTPPNFPSPIPTSWVVFAAPVAHLTVLPQQTEDLPLPSPSPYPFANGKTKQVQKRRDYDFSHAGTPLFEFSSNSVFTNGSPSLNFLSVENIGPWSASDPYGELSEEEYAVSRQIFNDNCEHRRFQSKSQAEHDNDGLNRCGEYDSDDEAAGINYGVGVAAPNKGIWWKEFYRRMYVDRAMWRSVRRAMGRGKCRVVVRWNEFEGGDVGDVDMEELAGQGVKHKRVTRSETRRRSGLGFGGGEVIGGLAGLGDSMRARALGNKDLRPTVKSKEKKRGVE
jgi:hypothetical protein